MKKTAMSSITLFVFIISLLVATNIYKVASYTNIQALKHNTFSKSDKIASTTNICTIPATITAVKSVAYAKQPVIVQQISSSSATAKSNNELTVLRKNAKNIDIYFSMSNGKKSFIRIENKSNGTWNLRDWYLSKDNQIPSKDAILLAGSSSDWEYVLRVTDKINTPIIFPAEVITMKYCKVSNSLIIKIIKNFF